MVILAFFVNEGKTDFITYDSLENCQLIILQQIGYNISYEFVINVYRNYCYNKFFQWSFAFRYKHVLLLLFLSKIPIHVL